MSFLWRDTIRRQYRTKSAVASVARERIEVLLNQARKVAAEDSALSKRYVSLAGKISKRTKVRIPSEQKRYLCKSCGMPLVQGVNARVRVHTSGSGLVITCLSCGNVKRYPIVSRTRAARKVSTMKAYIVQPLSSSKKNPTKD